MRQKLPLRILGWACLLLVILLWSCPGLAFGADGPLRVVLDDNYPPYVFRNSNGELEGILVDQWALWEKKTGVKVQLSAQDWGEAYSQMRRGQFDVIDTIFFSEERAQVFDYTLPYAPIDVAIFFHRNISGISGVESLKGFRVGVKSGDYIIDVLRQQGIHDLIEFNSYEAIVRAAKNQQLLVFAMDKPPALYFLYKMGLDKEYRYSPPVHSGAFHRAVTKGDTMTLRMVESGFAQISRNEYEGIENRWYGVSLDRPDYWAMAGGAVLLIALIVVFLLLWNMALKRSVARKTQELNHYVTALRTSEARLRGLFGHMQSGFAYYQLILDEDGSPVDAIFISANKAYEDFNRFRSEDLIGQRMTKVFADFADEHPEVLRIVSTVVRTGAPVTFERFSPHCNLWFRYSIYSPEPGYLAVLSENINEARQAEEAIRESGERYRAIMQQSSDAIALIDLQSRRLLEVNHRWLAMLGYDAAEIKDRPVGDFFAESPQRINAMLDAVVQHGSLPVELHRNRHKNGSIVEVERSLALIQFSGEKALMIVDRDVSAQRKLQRQLSKDLFLAADVQRSLLPAGFDDSRLRVETIYEPFYVVSGDFYDYLWDHNHTKFYGFLLDVVGHGVASSLQTLAVSVLYRQIAESPSSLADKLRWMNHHMLHYFPEDTYAAAIIFEIDIKKRTLSYATAGIYAFLASSAELPGWNTSPGSFLGIDAAPDYCENTVVIQNGDAFYFMSDGILDLLSDPRNLEPGEFIETVDRLRSLVSASERRDDCSAVCIQLQGLTALPLSFMLRRVEDHPRLRRRIHQTLRTMVGGGEERLCVALGEAITNALQHGREVRVRINKIGDQLIMRVRDDGPGFAGNELLARYSGQRQGYNFEEHLLDEHGRGIPIMMSWMDRVLYNQRGTEVLLIKNLQRNVSE